MFYHIHGLRIKYILRCQKLIQYRNPTQFFKENLPKESYTSLILRKKTSKTIFVKKTTKLLGKSGYSMTMDDLGIQVNNKVHLVYHVRIGITLGLYVLTKNKGVYPYHNPCFWVQLEPKYVFIRSFYLRIAGFGFNLRIKWGQMMC